MNDFLDAYSIQYSLESCPQAYLMDTEYGHPAGAKESDVVLEDPLLREQAIRTTALVGQNIILEGMAFSVFEMMQTSNRELNPKFAQTLAGTIADERRHVGFGENRIESLIREHPEKRGEIERMQQEMSYYMLATFADTFRSSETQEEMRHAREEAGPDRNAVSWHGVDLSAAEPDEIEAVLSNTVLAEFKTRLGRIGIDYQTPARPTA